MNDVQVSGLTMDSRRVKPRDLFFAVTGLTSDGRDFIEEAINKGATAVLVEEDLSSIRTRECHATINNIPLIPVQNLKNIMGCIAARFFEEPSKNLFVIGATGTNGKTSCTHFIAQILTYLGKQCGILGTLGAGYLNDLKKTNHTTADAITTQEMLATFRDNHSGFVAMEVTSHALTQGRVSGVDFHTAIFTNLTHDHLDYHLNMQQYGEAKKRLFTEFQPKYSIINLDDEFGYILMNDLARMKKPGLIGYTTHATPKISKANNSTFALITTHHFMLNANGMQALIRTPWGEGQLHCSLLGLFNLSNVLAVIAALCVQGFPLTEVLEAISHLKTVPGRMMRLGGALREPVVVIDYAHTPDALGQILSALRAHCKGKLWCVFGCGGDRDREKRPVMASVVETLSDRMIITQDNPRTEDPRQIVADMLKGLKNPKAVEIEIDRKQAIQNAICAADENDWVVIAGKGHEEYQILGNGRVPFCDETEAQNALKARAVCAH